MWGTQVCATKQGQEGQDSTQKLVKCWQKCIEAGGDYMEKRLCTTVNTY
jgi:hypothetical protein